MKIITHRGWSKGEGENTLQAFQKSIDAGVAGAEFDIRLSSTGEDVFVAHDMPENDEAPGLEEVLALLKEHSLELFIEIKDYSSVLLSRAINLIEKNGVARKTTIFGFECEMKDMLPKTHEAIKYGVIIEYPWNIAPAIQRYSPNAVLFGWEEERWWSRYAFRAYWSIFSLPHLFQKYPEITFIIGVANKKSDIMWLDKQRGLYGITTDEATIAKEVLIKEE